MATIAPQTPTILGTDLTAFTPTATTGDQFPLGARVKFLNSSGGSITITVVVPGNDPYGTARPDYTKSCANNALTAFGPIPADLIDPATGLATIICSAVSSVKGYATS